MNVACILADKSYPNYSEKTVYGLTFIERLIRQFHEFKFQDIIIISDMQISVPSVTSKTFQEGIDFLKKIKLQDDTQLFLVTSNIIMDDRLIRFTKDHKEDVQLTPQGGLAKLSGNNLKQFLLELDKIKDIDQLAGFTRQHANNYSVRTVTPNNFDSYIEDLRLNFVPYYFQYSKGSDLKIIENLMYEANFKGTMDFIATYIYKYPVREITKFLSPFKFITPNQITFLSIVSSFAVPLLFVGGFFGSAILIGWCMFIFDSVDGKLARLTVRLSRTAGIIEHATSAPAIFLWFAGLAWHFTDGQLFRFDDPNAIAGWTLMILYWVDKGANGIFRAKFKREIYDYSPLDKAFHLIACRRAIIMLIITTGYLAGNVEKSFHFLAFWMVCSFLFHLFRSVWISLSLSNRNKSKLNQV
jgi:phosphatidylglycerophosphate synthase